MKTTIKVIIKILLTLLVVVFVILNNPIVIKEEKIEPMYDENGIRYNDYDFSKLKKFDDLFFYEDDHYYSKLGVDLSSYQRDIDFNALKDNGIEFVYLRVAYRGYQTGEIHKDVYFESFYKRAKECGLEVGVYIFSAAINIEEAHEEANFILDAISDKEIDLPIVIDMEAIDYDEARTDNISNDEIKDIINTFISDVNKKGYDGSLYTNLQYIKDHLSPSDLVDWNLWVAQYNKVPDHQYAFNIWQYTESGVIKGIDERLDLNLMLVEKNTHPHNGHVFDNSHEFLK